MSQLQLERDEARYKSMIVWHLEELPQTTLKEAKAVKDSFGMTPEWQPRPLSKKEVMPPPMDQNNINEARHLKWCDGNSINAENI